MNAAITQTINKIADFMNGAENHKIEEWLKNDAESEKLIPVLLQELQKNGWKFGESIANYQSAETKKICFEIYERAMKFYK